MIEVGFIPSSITKLRRGSKDVATFNVRWETRCRSATIDFNTYSLHLDLAVLTTLRNFKEAHHASYRENEAHDVPGRMS
jgi:hypothetical protein